MRLALAITTSPPGGLRCSAAALEAGGGGHSVAAEGALLAHEASEGSLDTFTREHAKALRKLLGQLRPAIDDDRLAHTSDAVDAALADLAEHPGDRTNASGSNAASMMRRRRQTSWRDEERLRHRARHPGRDRRLRRHRRHRLQRRRGRNLRLSAPVGGRARGGRDHHVRRDVRARRCGLGDRRVRRGPGAARLLGRLGRTPRRRARQPADARGGDRRRCDRAPASLGPLLPGAARPRRPRARARPVADAVRVDRAHLRLLRPRTARLRGRRVQAQPGLGRGRARLRPVDRKRERLGLRVLRRRPRRGGDDSVRGLLLLVGRDRGAVGAEGSRAQPRERRDRLLPRRPALLCPDDLGGRVAAAERDQRRAARHGRAGRAGSDRPGRA